MANSVVKIGDREVTLSPPDSYTIRHEIVASAASNWRRAFAAALACCWRGGGRPKTKYAQADYNPLRYGGLVIDELTARGDDLAEVLEAGGVAFGLLAKDLISEKEVADAEDFSEAPEG